VVPAATPVAAEPVVESAPEPVAEPANEPANERPVEAQPHEAANDPATSDTDGVVDAKIAACAVEVSSMISDSHTRVYTSLTSDRAKADATDEELRALRKNVTRLEGIVDEAADRRRLVEGDQGVAPPS